MHLTVSARQCEITDRLRERARTVMQRLDQLTPFARDGAVVFGLDGQTHTVELRCHLAGGQVMIAHGEGVDHRTALDRAAGKLRRQLERPTAKSNRGRRAVRKP